MAESLRAELEASPGAKGLALVLHGYGDQPSRLLRLMGLIDVERNRCWLAPYGPGETADGGPSWFPAGDRGEGLELHDALGRIDESVKRNSAGLDLAQDRGAAPGDVVLVGHSQGAAVALALACRADPPWRPKGVVSIAGWLPHEADVEWDLAGAAGTRFLIAHGAEDDVVPAQMGRASARALERAGAEVAWYEHPGGHELPRSVLQAARDWLSALDRQADASDQPTPLGRRAPELDSEATRDDTGRA